MIFPIYNKNDLDAANMVNVWVAAVMVVAGIGLAVAGVSLPPLSPSFAFLAPLFNSDACAGSGGGGSAYAQE